MKARFWKLSANTFGKEYKPIIVDVRENPCSYVLRFDRVNHHVKMVAFAIQEQLLSVLPQLDVVNPGWNSGEAIILCCSFSFTLSLNNCQFEINFKSRTERGIHTAILCSMDHILTRNSSTLGEVWCQLETSQVLNRNCQIYWSRWRQVSPSMDNQYDQIFSHSSRKAIDP